jgi:hypothetical protein
MQIATETSQSLSNVPVDVYCSIMLRAYRDVSVKLVASADTCSSVVALKVDDGHKTTEYCFDMRYLSFMIGKRLSL